MKGVVGFCHLTSWGDLSKRRSFPGFLESPASGGKGDSTRTKN